MVLSVSSWMRIVPSPSSSNSSATPSIETYKLAIQKLECSISERLRKLTDAASPTPSLCSRCLIVGKRLEDIISSSTDETTKQEALGGGSRDAAGNVYLGPLNEVFAQDDCALCCLITKQLIRDKRLVLYHVIESDPEFGYEGLTLDRILNYVSPPEDTEEQEMELRELSSSAVQISLYEVPDDGTMSIWWPQHVADDINDESTRLMMFSEDHQLHFPDTKTWFPLPKNITRTERDIDMLLNCYNICLEHHSDCKVVGRRFRPTRLIDVEEMKIATVPPGATPDYFALSYVWGQVPCLLLKRGNLTKLCTRGALHEQSLSLPKTIQDAIQVTRSLKCRYIWVDALCIIQDDENDKTHQIARMHHIYTQAELTIVAATGDNADSGLLTTESVYHQTEPHIIGGCRFTTAATEMRDNVEVSTWFSRGWTFQELVFSGRILYFTPERTYFTCAIGNWSEDFPVNDDVPPHEKDPARDQDPKSEFTFSADIDPFENYSLMAEKLCIRAFTNEGDVLIASRGFYTGLLSKELGGSVCGLPAKCFEFALAWQPEGELTKRTAPRNGLPFPSWSWASWTGNITYPFLSGPKKLNPGSLIFWRICRPVAQADRTAKAELESKEIVLETVLPLLESDPDAQNGVVSSWKSPTHRVLGKRKWKSRGNRYEVTNTVSQDLAPGWRGPSIMPVGFIDTGLLIFDTYHIICLLQETDTPQLAQRKSLQYFSIFLVDDYIGELKIDTTTLAEIPEHTSGMYIAKLISLFVLDFGSTTMQDLMWLNSSSERGIFSQEFAKFVEGLEDKSMHVVMWIVEDGDIAYRVAIGYVVAKAFHSALNTEIILG